MTRLASRPKVPRVGTTTDADANIAEGGPAATETIVPAALLHLAENIEADVTPLVAQAGQAFGAAHIAGSAFSQAGIGLQVACPGTRDFAVQDAATKVAELDTVHDNLVSTAGTWAGAESHSTVRPR